MNENTSINAATEAPETCAICGCCDEELFELWIDGEYRMVCADCAEQNGYVRCEDCGAWVHEDDVIPVDEDIRYTYTSYVCPDCADNYFRCDNCGNYYSDRYTRRDDYGNVICDSCYEDGDYITCDDCGRITDDFEEIDGSYYCWACAGDHRHRGVHDYGYKPYPEFQFTPAERNTVSPLDSILTFGVELEVDDGDDASDLCDDLEELGLPIYMKHDGSLNDEGVEIVTHPASLAFHASGMSWNGIAATCRDHDYQSHNTDTCGLHIHVGRRGMGPDGRSRDNTAANLVLLTVSLWDKLVKFSRRRESKLNEWAAKPELRTETWHGPLDYTKDDDLREAAMLTQNSGRYQAVNLTNAATVEFRLFRGTLNRDTLLASIQLTSNLTRYAMTHTPTECRAAKWSDIMQVETYPELTAYCEKREIA